MALGAGAAVSLGIDALSALFSPPAAKAKTGFSNASSFNVSAPSATAQATSAARAAPLAPDTFNALLSAQGTASATPGDRSAALNRLFAALDTNGDGQIAKAEFQDQLGAGGTNTANANRVFAKIDTDGDGSVSIEELTAALSTQKKRHVNKPGEGATIDPLLKALKGGSGSSTVNADGSTTTAVTYADGSKVTLTKPTAAAAASSYNVVERAIEQQARYLAASSTTTVKVSA